MDGDITGIRFACCIRFGYLPPAVRGDVKGSPTKPVTKGGEVFHMGIFKMANAAAATKFYFFDMRPGAPALCPACSYKHQRPHFVEDHPNSKGAQREGKMSK